jgi:cyclohexadienyl dehydratase
VLLAVLIIRLLAGLLAGLLPATIAHAEEVASKALRVATSGDYAPFSFTSEPAATPGTAVADVAVDGGTSDEAAASGTAGSATVASASNVTASARDLGLSGFDIDVATMFARDTGRRAGFLRFRWPDLGRQLAAGDFDLAMSGVTIRPERSVAGRYSVPVAETHAVALTWKGSGVTDVKGLDWPSRRIAVNAGGHLENVARETFRRAIVVAIPDNEAVRMAMLDRGFDAVVTDNYEARVWTAGVRNVVVLGPLSDDRKAYLLPAGNGDLAAELDRWLLAREKDGTLARLRSRYFCGDAAPVAGDSAAACAEASAAANPVAALASAVVERLALMPMVYQAKRLAGKPVEDKDQEAAVLESAVRALTEAAAAAGTPPPDAEAGKQLFAVLIAMGKDVQQALADEDARRRPGTVRYRPKASATGGVASGTPPASASNAIPPDTAATDPAAAAPPPASSTVAAVAAAEEARRPGLRKPVYDLATQLRPAIGRITDKIARIIAAMDTPVTVAEARRHLVDTLKAKGVKPERIDELAAAVVRISGQRPVSK